MKYYLFNVNSEQYSLSSNYLQVSTCWMLPTGIKNSQLLNSLDILFWSLLLSATKLRRLCFYRHVSVHGWGGGVCLSACWDTTPQSRHPPEQNHPPPRSRHPQETATVADGTHPTGMHSCVNNWIWNTSHYWWLFRITLMVTFGFLPQNFGMWWGPTNGTLSMILRLQIQWWGHSNPIFCKKNCLNF